jgi:inosine-uridine nucleoside N-ribohydrolase
MKGMRNARIFLALAAMMAASVAASQAPKALPPPAVNPELVILDTDIGDDIDDAFALALVLRSPELRLIGITTTYGDTELRAELVDRYLTAIGRWDLPVATGVSTPHDNVFTQAVYASKLKSPDRIFISPGLGFTISKAKHQPKIKHATSADQRICGDATGFLLEKIRAHPGQITLIAIGPLFNIQAAIERDPATFRKLKLVVLMGGSIYRGYDGRDGTHRPPDAEWNVSRDPEGLRALLASGVPVFMMPLDSTQIHLETPAREAIFAHGSPLTDQLTLLYHQWMAGTEGHPLAPTLFDPVAVAYVIRPELCPATPMRLEVDDKGFTRPVDGPTNAQVCLKSDEKGFLELLLGRIIGKAAR